jgi:carbamoyl-phosphate synthase/aspartate carbamoyltransferase
VPRWDLTKFNKVSTTLGSSMTSVGEVMAIGRSFEEAMQKAVRMVSGGQLAGLDGGLPNGYTETLEQLLARPNDKRLWAVQLALERGVSIDEVHSLTRIDRWFLSKLARIAAMKADACRARLDQLGRGHMLALKAAGFSDRQLASYTGANEQDVRRHRLGMQPPVRPFSKQIDTLAAEFPACTNYMYMTYNASEDDVVEGTSAAAGQEATGAGSGSGGVMVLGCGAYCIGSSVEFDWCAVSAVREVRASGVRAIVVNYNPETVSTDFDESDALYFEELTLERVLDIFWHERSTGVMVSVGGQIPNNLALPLQQHGVRVLGTCPTDIDRAEDRHQFSALLDSIGVDQPPWSELRCTESALAFAAKVGLPVRPAPSPSPTPLHPCCAGASPIRE